MKILETERLLLRTWVDKDLPLMFDINQDPKVMEYFPELQDLETTREFIKKANDHFKKYRYSFFATVRKDNNEFIGFIGLFHVGFKASFTPAIEIGWRLSSNHWGKGFATEGARGVLDYAFKNLQLSEIVSFTAQNNLKSIRVMQKIGMLHSRKDDFKHPKLDSSSPLKRHVLYKINKSQYFK